MRNIAVALLMPIAVVKIEDCRGRKAMLVGHKGIIG